MRTIQPGTGVGNTKTGNARAARCANSNGKPAPGYLRTGCIPPPTPKRWLSYRKAEIVAAVRGGFISLEEALKRYALTMEEYLTWQEGIDLLGLPGLRVNKTQQRRGRGICSPDPGSEESPSFDAARRPSGSR